MGNMTFGTFALLQLVGVCYAFAGAILMLAGVALGGWLVFRTKRESHEPLFKAPALGRQDELRPYHLEDDVYSDEPEEAEPDNSYYDAGMYAVDAQVERFIQQQTDSKRTAI